jgi:anthrone oxygenase-like protein
MLLELIATLCTGLFAGAAIYITLVEHPARLACGTAAAVDQFRPSYRRAAVMQASLALVGLLAALGAWVQGRGTPVLLAGLLLGAVVPFTLVVILPSTKRLLDPGLDPTSSQAAALLERWGRLHAVRSGAALLALVVLLLHLGR